MKDERLQRLRKKAITLPLTPGVYIMKNKSGKIIYIGKAKALKNRVSQYFGSNKNHDEKVKQMILNVENFDYILTDTEFEALVLESSLIKQNQPKYNILLKDDKGYHYIKITKGKWRKITAVKNILNDDADYIGPYLKFGLVQQSVDEANKIFKLPSCNRRFPEDIGKSRPCLNYYIKQCNAPCRGHYTQAEHEESVQSAINFLKGGSSEALREMTKAMEESAENLDFERAAKLRDRINAIKKMADKQKVISLKHPNQDVIALSQMGKSSCFSVLRFKEGHLFDKEDFITSNVGKITKAREEFIEQYYSIRDDIPQMISLDGEADNQDLLSQWLTQKLGRKVTITIPQKGEQQHLVEMCRNNAAEHLAQISGRTGKETAALDELARLLNLSKPPEYIESYDISNTAGSENVAGMIVFQRGRPLKSSYRKFKIKGFDGQDDYGSMREVITRRFNEYLKLKDTECDGFARLPDLILLDGGRTHVLAVKPIIESFGLDIPVFGMVKDDKHKTRAIAKDGGEIAINSNRSAFTLISTIQEEVHRFAIGYHRQSRKKNTLTSSLLEIDGVGQTRATQLLKHFKTITRIKQASLEELELVKGITKPVAYAIYNHFQNEDI